MEIRFYSLKIRKMEKKYQKDDNVHPSKKKENKEKKDDIALSIYL